MSNNIRETMEFREKQMLSPYAVCSADSIGRERPEEECDMRTAFQRDRDRILHSLSLIHICYTIVRAEEPKKKEETDISGVLEESLLSFYGAMVSKGIVPEIQVPDKKIIRNVNKASLVRVFGNIISNMIKYSEGEMKVKLLENGEMHFSNKAPKLQAVQVEKLFDRFFTVEDARISTGLGLSIAKTLTEEMGGSIRAEYREETLTIFLIF